MSSDESEEEELHDDNLLASSDDDDDSEEEAAPAGDASKFMGGSGSDDESGESDDELPIERQARKLDDEAAKVQREDAEELKQQEQGLLAPDSDGEEDGADTRGDDGAPPIDLAAVQTRIHENVKVCRPPRASALASAAAQGLASKSSQQGYPGRLTSPGVFVRPADPRELYGAQERRLKLDNDATVGVPAAADGRHGRVLRLPAVPDREVPRAVLALADGGIPRGQRGRPAGDHPDQHTALPP